ncbi:MAG: hypothetical protein ABFC57_16145 [Veillonellales bacterium]
MTILWTLLKNPKNLAIALLGVLVLICGFLYLWQRVSLKAKETTIATQKASIEALSVMVKDLTGQVSEYKAQVVKQKAVAVQQQAVENETAKLREQINKIKSQCVLGVEDEKIVDDVTTYFNNGVRSRSSDPKIGRQVLPAASKADTFNPRWTIRQIVDNYIIVIDYSLKMEKTLNCYEGGK